MRVSTGGTIPESIVVPVPAAACQITIKKDLMTDRIGGQAIFAGKPVCRPAEKQAVYPITGNNRKRSGYDARIPYAGADAPVIFILTI